MTSKQIVKIGHIADLHLRDTQYARRSRGDDFYQGVINAIDALIKAGAECILCSGDVLDTTRPSAHVMSQLKSIHTHLRSKKITMYTTAGNHCQTDPHWSSLLDSEDSISSYGIQYIENQKVFLPSGISIYGIPFCSNDLFREFLTSPETEADILMWHGAIKEFSGYPQTDAVEMDDFPKSKYKLVAMGDQHIHKYIKQDIGDTIIAYPGSTEMCSTSEDENKNAFLYSFDAETKTIVEIESIPFLTRTVQRFHIDSEDQIAEVANSIQKESIVLLTLSSKLRGNMQVLYAAVAIKNCILQLKIEADTKEQEIAHTGMIGTIHDTLKEIPGIKDKSYYTLAQDLLNTQVQARDAIDTYITNKLNITLI